MKISHSLIDIRRDALHQEVERLWETENNERAITRQQHWDALGRLQQRSYQNLPANLDRTPQTSHPEHNSAQEQNLLLNLNQRHYHYDALGQLTHIQQPKQIQYYAYDAHGRLTAARLGDEETARQNWRFDAAGNPLPPAHAPQPTPQDWTETVRQRWQEPDFNLIQPDTQAPATQAHCWPDNRVGFSEHERYQYDAQGNRTESHNTKTGDIRHYTYNALNQLVQLDHYKQNNQLERSTYLYDPLGRRLEKQIEHYQIEEHGQQQHLTATGQNSAEYYGWDGDRLVFCNDQKQQWHYLYEPDSFTPMLLIRQDNKQAVNEGEQILKDNMAMFQDTLRQLPNGEAEEARQQMREHIITTLKQQDLWQEPALPQEYYLYHCNHLGLPDALTDQEGSIAWAAEYDPWGNVQSEHNPQKLKQNIRLPGQYHDPETGLYYNRHRYYDPALGSYINQDPIGLDSGEPNFYAYPPNPLQRMDPLGLEADKAQKSPFNDIVGDVVRETIINKRSAQRANRWDSAVKHACENNGRIIECMKRLDEYEAALKLDRSVGKHPAVQALVELGRETGKEQACMAINICDTSGYMFNQIPDIEPPKLKDVMSEIKPPFQ